MAAVVTLLSLPTALASYSAGFAGFEIARGKSYTYTIVNAKKLMMVLLVELYP